MRTNYPLFSKELNDIFQDLYYKLVYLLGYTDSDAAKSYEGVYDNIELTIYELTNSLILQEDSSNTLIYQTPNGNIPLYSVWGNYIIMNELRSLS